MKNIFRILSLLVLLAACSRSAGEFPATTLRSFGAVGDGRTDDRAAIEAALVKANGSLVDGEGAAYAVHGNIEVSVGVNFRNATLVQTMAAVDMSKYIPSAKGTGTLTVQPAEALRSMVEGVPLMLASGVATYSEDSVLGGEDLKAVLPSVALRTLAFRGSAGKPISVRLEKIKIMRGNHPQTGGRNDGAGIRVDYGSPVNMSDVEITGDGKGTGLFIGNCSKVRLERVNIHDMNWAPYLGDDIFDRLSVESLKADFGWNNFPIYEFRVALNRFVRVRIQEQLVGLFLLLSEDVQVLDSRIARLQTRIGDNLYPLQADGMTVNQVKNLVIRNCDSSQVWEGIDFTGRGGEGFVFENCTSSDTFTFGFKFAHPKRDGKVINCTAERAGNAGFEIGAESENIEFIGCKALETGASGSWTLDDGRRLMSVCGFRIRAKAGSTTPNRIRIVQCTAVNKTRAGAMDFGIFCAPEAAGADRGITLIEASAQGAKIKDIEGFSSK